MSLTPGSRLGPYEVLQPLGSGGMGEVYSARDVNLRRVVALKVLPESLAADPGRLARFEREAQLASSLNHPNIITIHGIGREGAVSYIAMEMIDGQTLQAARASGAWSVDRVVDTATQIASGLAKAHEAGIVHRDLKPQNVMITKDGFVKILDFGLSTLAPDADPSNASTMTDIGLTRPGAVLGTVHYMSPEQAAGRPADFRSDQFSFGVVVYELLTGRRPFEGPTAVQVLSKIIEGAPPSLAAIDPAVPDRVCAIVDRCLSKRPEDRYGSTLDLARDLTDARGASAAPAARRGFARHRGRWIAAAALVALASSLAFPGVRARLRSPFGAPAGAGEAPVVAVLPFEVLSGTPGDEYLSIGFADSLITDLARLQETTVVRREDMREVRKDRDPRSVARAVGATLVVDGRIQKVNDRFRINLDIRRADGSLVWTHPFEDAGDRVFDLQRQIADGVIARLGIAARQVDTPRTSDLAALTGYWQARALIDRADVPGNLMSAITELTSVVSRDPAFVSARAALGEAALLRYVETKDRKWHDLALGESTRAAQQDPTQAEGYIALARVYKQETRAQEAIEALQHVIKIQPTNDNAHEVLGDTLVAAGRSAEGIEQLQRAVALRPRFPGHHTRLGVALYGAGRFDESLAELRRVVELQPDNAMAFHRLATVSQASGDKAKALESYAEAIRLGAPAITALNMGMLQYEDGRYQEAATLFEQTVRARPKEPQYRRNLGDAYQQLKQPEKARVQYEECVGLSAELLKLSPQNADYLSQHAVCLAKVGRFGQADRDIAEALRLGPANGTWRYRQAVILSVGRRIPEALAALDAALANGYSSKLAGKDTDLENIRSRPEFKAILQRYLP
jgi:tetratricopeptide (TPR) repeat protein